MYKESITGPYLRIQHKIKTEKNAWTCATANGMVQQCQHG